MHCCDVLLSFEPQQAMSVTKKGLSVSGQSPMPEIRIVARDNGMVRGRVILFTARMFSLERARLPVMLHWRCVCGQGVLIPLNIPN